MSFFEPAQFWSNYNDIFAIKSYHYQKLQRI